MRLSGIPGTITAMNHGDTPDQQTVADLNLPDWVGLDPATPLADLTPEVRAALQANWGLDPRDVPPGPWSWRRVAPAGESDERGEALVASDATWVLWSESGYG